MPQKSLKIHYRLLLPLKTVLLVFLSFGNISRMRSAAAAGSPMTNYETKWFDQRLDHFNKTDESTLPQRYLINTEFWCGKDCPILFYLGGESDIEISANETGWMWENAPKLEAMIVFAEHRYYGRSMPKSIDEKNLALLEKKDQGKIFAHLQVELALQDFLELIHQIKNNLYDAKHSPVIAVGGSYAGMLATWMRINYPNVIIGALAASAPLLELREGFDCYSLDKAIARSYKRCSETCLQRIRAFRRLLKTFDIDSGNIVALLNGMSNEKLNLLSSSFKTCKVIEPGSGMYQLDNKLREVWGDMAVANYAHPANLFAPMPANPVKEACKIISEPPDPISDEELIERIAKASQIYTNYTGQLSCFEVEKPNGHDPPPQWNFQLCSELTTEYCSDGENSLFINKLKSSKTQAVKECEEIWNIKSRWEKVRALGGDEKSLKSSSKIIFSSGSYDPFSYACIHDSHEENSIYAIEIPEVGHHEDILTSGPNDSREIKKARQLELNITNNWIYDYYKSIANVSNETFAWPMKHQLVDIVLEPKGFSSNGLLKYVYNLLTG